MLKHSQSKNCIKSGLGQFCKRRINWNLAD